MNNILNYAVKQKYVHYSNCSYTDNVLIAINIGLAITIDSKFTNISLACSSKKST